MGSPGAQPTLIQSVQRALRLIEAVSALDGRAQAKELARSVDLSLSTTYHLLRTLTHEGYLRRLDDGSYVLGPTLTQVATQDRMAAVLARARPAMQGLRDELRAPAYLALYHEGEIAVVEIVDSPKVPSIDLWVGIHDSAHATALGKCILGALDDTKRRDYLARHPLHQLTRRTVTDRRTLENEIHRSSTLARDEEEYAVGVSCLAAPVVTPDLTGAVAVARRQHHRRGEPDEQVVETLQRSARRIQRALGLPVSA
ncbi:MAG: helix-turn-helix domain-containing protein [Actinomycetales bacterium]|nr:helix-turn-helix domain-containing protein [Actinomycetales bacterium]